MQLCPVLTVMTAQTVRREHFLTHLILTLILSCRLKWCWRKDDSGNFEQVRDLSSLVKRTAALQAGMGMVHNTGESELCLALQTDSPTFLSKALGAGKHGRGFLRR